MAAGAPVQILELRKLDGGVVALNTAAYGLGRRPFAGKGLLLGFSAGRRGSACRSADGEPP